MIPKMISMDWRAMKTYQNRAWLLPVFMLFSSLYMPLAIFPMSIFLLLSYSVNPFAVEEKGELNHLYLTMPVSRKMIVSARYLLSLIMMIGGMVLSACILPLANLLSPSKWYLDAKAYLIILSCCYLLYAILNLFMFPVLFKLGYQKGKFWGFYLPAVSFSVLFVVYSLIAGLPGNESLTFDLIVWASNNRILVSILAILLATLILFASYLISLRVYKKRDF